MVTNTKHYSQKYFIVNFLKFFILINQNSCRMVTGKAWSSKQALVLSGNFEFRSKNLLSIQIDHIPISLQMSGSFEGNMRLNDKAPPNNIDAYPWTSKTVYKAVPGTAGFLVAVEALGAKVAAVFWATCYENRHKNQYTLSNALLSATCNSRNVFQVNYPEFTKAQWFSIFHSPNPKY